MATTIFFIAIPTSLSFVVGIVLLCISSLLDVNIFLLIKTLCIFYKKRLTFMGKSGKLDVVKDWEGGDSNGLRCPAAEANAAVITC